jgi:hypothetical protein
VVDGFDLYRYWRFAVLWSQKDVKGIGLGWLFTYYGVLFFHETGLLFPWIDEEWMDGAQMSVTAVF